MGMPKKGSRKICVDQVRYRWVSRELSPGLRFVVQAIEHQGAVLILHTDQNIAATHVPPARIASAILAARAAGWEPYRPGPPFKMPVTV